MTHQHPIKTIALVDLVKGGHHGTYMRFFTEALIELGHNVIILYPEADEQEASNKNGQSIERSTYIQFTNIFPRSIAKSFRFRALSCWLSTTWAIYINQFRRKIPKPDLVFFNSIDDFRFTKDHPLINKLFLKIVGTIFSHRWSGLYFHPDHLRDLRYERDKFILHGIGGFEIDKIFTLKNCESIAILDEGVQEALTKKLKKPVLTFPDITNQELGAETSPLADAIKSQAGSRKIIALMGALNTRKGVVPLLEVAKMSNKNEDPWYFIFVGSLYKDSFSKDEQERIDRERNNQNSNCYFHFDPVPDGNEFNSILSIADLLYAVYLQFPHSSNILTKSAAFRIPVLVSKGYCMEERVANFNLGESVEEGNIQDIYIKVKSMMGAIDILKSDAKFSEYLTLHSTDALLRSFSKVLNTDRT